MTRLSVFSPCLLDGRRGLRGGRGGAGRLLTTGEWSGDSEVFKSTVPRGRWIASSVEGVIGKLCVSSVIVAESVLSSTLGREGGYMEGVEGVREACLRRGGGVGGSLFVFGIFARVLIF